MVGVLTWFFTWLQEWASVLSGFGSIILTAGLVYLYSQQTSIQEDQQDLLRRELNREVRQGHTETLRKRIRAWHGDMDEIGVPEGGGWFTDETNLPKVRGASVEPAPSIIPTVPRDPTFRVVPAVIENDRYLQDLLTNHAPDLRELKEEIERQYSEFESAKATFRETCPDGETIEADAYTIQPRPKFSEWVFERAVLLNRGHEDRDKQELKDITEDRLNGTNPANPENGKKLFSPTGIDGTGPATYEATAVSGDDDVLRESNDEIVTPIIEIHWDAIDDIENTENYGAAVTAAETLDEMAESVENLKAKLVEHEGHPIYLEDCEYLNNVTL